MKKKLTILLALLILGSLLLSACGAAVPAKDTCTAGKWNPFQPNVTVRFGGTNPYNAGEKCYADGKFHTYLPAPPTAPRVNEPAPQAPPRTEEPAPPVSTPSGNTSGKYFDACNSVDMDDDITHLKENGQVIPNSFMFLDKNETEVPSGDYWFINVPANVYGHVFFPVTGLTYQVRGPVKLQVGVATFWCDNGGSTPHDGQYQMLDAKRISEDCLNSNWELEDDCAIGDWVNVPPVENQPK